MVKVFITHLEGVLTKEGSESSEYIPYCRAIGESGQGRSIQGKPLSIKHIVPTFFIHADKRESFRLMMEKYKDIFSGYRIDARLEKQEGEYLVWHAELSSHLTQKVRRRILPKKFITGKEDQATRLALWRANVPYSIYDFDELTGNLQQPGAINHLEQYVTLESLLKEKKCAIDIETEDWKKEMLDQSITSMNDAALKKFYLLLAGQTKNNVHPEHLQYWKRKDFLAKIDLMVDSLRQEKISAAPYITFRGNDAVFHIFDCVKDIPFILIDIPGRDEKLKVSLACVKGTEEIGKSLTQIIQQDDPLFCFGTNHLNFDYKKLDVLTKGNFQPGVGQEAPSYDANIVTGFQQRRIIPGRFDLDTFAYSLQSSWTYRNNLDTSFNYMLGKTEKKTLNYDELIIKTQQARQGDRDAALEIIYYAAQDAMKSFLLGDYLLEEVLAESMQFSAQTSRICTTSKRTLMDDKIQKMHWERKKTYKIFDKSDAGDWDKFSIYDAFWQALERKQGAFKAKKGMFNAHIIFPTLYYQTLLPAMHRTAEPVINLLEKTIDVKKKIRLMEYAAAELEWILFNLKKEYANSRAIAQDKRDICDYRFRQACGIADTASGLTIDLYTNELKEKMETFDSLLGTINAINHSERFLVLERTLLSDAVIGELEEKKLAIELGKGKVLSDGKGRFIAMIDGQIISQGIDPEGKRNRCGYETLLIQGFIQRALELGDPKDALRFADGNIKKFYANEIPEDLLIYKRTARKDFLEYSDRAKTEFIDKAIELQVKEGEQYSYTRTRQENEEAFFGKDGTITNILNMRFPVRKLKGSALGRMLSGDGNEAVFEEIINAASRKS